MRVLEKRRLVCRRGGDRLEQFHERKHPLHYQPLFVVRQLRFSSARYTKSDNRNSSVRYDSRQYGLRVFSSVRFHPVLRPPVLVLRPGQKGLTKSEKTALELCTIRSLSVLT